MVRKGLIMEMDGILRVMPSAVRRPLQEAVEDVSLLREIRLRSGREMFIYYDNKERVLGRNGFTVTEDAGRIIISEQMIKETIDYISNYSLYAVEEELGRGYITIAGGHRAGICGHVVLSGGKVKAVRNISSVNLRIAHEMPGCAMKLANGIYQEGRMENTLIISPPGGGKTTLLRDLIRVLSEKGYQIGVVDERSEIAAMSGATPGNNLGPRVDILDGCPKAIGITMLLRSMAPDIIAVDEIGSEDDVKEIGYAAVSGCNVIATAHGHDVEDVKRNTRLKSLIEEGFFRRVVVLGKTPMPGTVVNIYRGKQS